MAADEAGNDVTNVGIPLTGFLAYADATNATIPTPSEGAAVPLTLGSSFRKVGLLTDDGGFEWDEKPDGDAIEFFQDGYNIPTGLAEVTLKVTLAEDSAITRELVTGKKPDVNGYYTVSGGGNAKSYAFFSEEVYRNGAVRRRAAFGRVTEAKRVKAERGKVEGVEVTITITPNPVFKYDHYGEWFISPQA